MTRKLSRLVPTGIGAAPVILIFLAGLVLSGFTAFSSFLAAFLHYYGQITYYDEAGSKGFRSDAVMQPLTSFNSEFDIFKLYFVCMALAGVYFFIYHFAGSKSIYTMRRLKNPLELYVRCFAVPVIFILLGIALVYLLNLIYISIYASLVPEECMHPGWNADIWRDLL